MSRVGKKETKFVTDKKVLNFFNFALSTNQMVCADHAHSMAAPTGSCLSLAVLVDIDDGILSPAEEEVADGQTEDQRQAEPHVVRHENQHEGVGGCRLQEV